MASYAERVDDLRQRLASFERLAIAVSGGVDSCVLLHAARTVLGAERAVGLIADSASLPRSELAQAQALARSVRARLIVLPTDELSKAGYRENLGERCYWCRHTLFEAMRDWASEHDFSALAYGEITDDLLDVRPGRRAAHEFGVVAPLAQAGFDKGDVRRYARSFALPVAEKPASACLASRLPPGTEVSVERLRRIERAESLVRARGLRVLRVRDHGARARLEVGPDELEEARRQRSAIEVELCELGFETLELAVYRRPEIRVRDELALEDR